MVLKSVVEDEDDWIEVERKVVETGRLVELEDCCPALNTISYTAAAERPPQVVLGSP